jgi:transcriptional regulator with XRE-family HTH domain
MSAFGAGAQSRHLAEELKRLRIASGLTGRQIAPLIGVKQSTISRIEGGLQRVSFQQVALWCKATGASDEKTAELLALAEDILVGPRTWRDASETGSTDLQPEIAKLEAKTGLLSIYEPAAFPGLLQTAAYARRLFSSGPEGELPDVAERVMHRLERQPILYDERKRFRFVIPEAVLRWPYGPPDDPAVLDEHLEQLARVEALIGRPNVEIGILPLRPTAPWRLAGFDIYDEVEGDEPVVHLGSWLTRPYFITEPDQVEMCRQAFANLLGASISGEDARRLITAAARELQEEGRQ